MQQQFLLCPSQRNFQAVRFSGTGIFSRLYFAADSEDPTSFEVLKLERHWKAAFVSML